MWSCEITWQPENNISTAAMLVATELGKVVAYLYCLLPTKLSRGHVRSRDKLKACLHYHATYGHQT